MTEGDALIENADEMSTLSDLLSAKRLPVTEEFLESAFTLETEASALIPKAAAKNSPFGCLSDLLFKLVG
ncbi:hypothetical protein SPM24T3_14371 [Serratia sp. M24T3]|nr:hypothetical protein SPM24T3_14371 [Serratia sp. M24T3]